MIAKIMWNGSGSIIQAVPVYVYTQFAYNCNLEYSHAQHTTTQLVMIDHQSKTKNTSRHNNSNLKFHVSIIAFGCVLSKSKCM